MDRDDHFMDLTSDAQGNLIVVGGLPKDGGLHGRWKRDPTGSYHGRDFQLFYFNLQDNVQERVDTFLKESPKLVKQ